MVDGRTDENLVDDLAEEFARRWRAGDRPSIAEYVDRYPAWADDIRTVLPAVLMMEQLKPRRWDTSTAETVSVAKDLVPDRIGDYRILREIGRGGMGVVYEAEQEALGRRVAIKVLPGHLLANEKLRARFHREAQAAARLHHTNIVPVFGVGEQDGRCFYVMQLISGRSLDQLIRDLAIDRGPSGTSESPQEFFHTVARIGFQVADALAAAHAQGVFHRDVKPSNLLLDDRGTVWVTDFGVAKLVEEANLTQSGDVVGTLKYMPPERFSGRSDARGDVYSLGITLYELLTLRSAFPDTNPQHLIQLITHDTPARPRKLNPDIPTDLETIILKATARDPAHRYQTPGQMGEDLRRFLEDRPILAKRAGAAERIWRWCRRNPALAAATAASFLLMVAITLVSVAAWVQTAAANRETRKALDSEIAQREQAELASTLALDALNRIYDRFAPTRLVVTPQVSNDSDVEIPAQPALPPGAVGLLEDLLRTYEQLARAGGEFPKLQPQAAEANCRIGDISQRLGRFEKAADAYRTAIALYDNLPADSSEETMFIKRARACNELGRALRSMQQYDEAIRMHEKAIQTLGAAPKAFANRPECRFELARSYCLLAQRDMLQSGGGPGPPPGRPGEPGRHRPERGKRPPADRPRPHDEFGPPLREGPDARSRADSARRAVELLEQLVREFPKVPEYQHLLACCYREMPPEGPPGHGPDSRQARKDRAVELLRKLVKDHPLVPDYRLDLCETLAQPGPPRRSGQADDITDEQDRLKEAVSLAKQLVEEYPNVPDYRSVHARALDRQGMTLLHAGKLDEAEKAQRKAVEIQQRLVKHYPDSVAFSFWLGLMERMLGRILSERGQWTEARRLLEGATNRVEGLWKKDPRLVGAKPFLGMAYRELARALSQVGEKAQAEAAQRKADAFGPDRGPGPPRGRERGERRP